MANNCYFCSEPITIKDTGIPTISEIFCQSCGKYRLLPDGLSAAKKHEGIIAGYLFETKERREDPFVIDEAKVNQILSSPIIARTLTQKITKLVTYINSKSNYLGELIDVPTAAMYLSNENEKRQFLIALKNEGLIHSSGNLIDGPRLSLTLRALEHFLDKADSVKKNQCFVAMWFNEEMDRLFEEIIKPSCREVGYEAVRVSDREFVDYITDEIIAGIKESDFVIADYTGQRGGVYYEAGYAMGLGKTVIQMCREDELGKLHFDISQRNTIVWEYAEVDKAQAMLKNRIRATVGRGTATIDATIGF